LILLLLFQQQQQQQQQQHTTYFITTVTYRQGGWQNVAVDPNTIIMLTCLLTWQEAPTVTKVSSLKDMEKM
jgi:hypothetical protein